MNPQPRDADKRMQEPDGRRREGRLGRRKRKQETGFPMGTRHLKAEMQSWQCSVQNLLMNLLPDCWISSRFMRPSLGRLMGMKCGRRTFLRKGSFYGNVKNIAIGTGTRMNRDVFLDAYDKITLGSNVFIGFQVTFITSAHEMGNAQQRCGRLYGQPIVVEDGVWIGACAKIGPGVTLGAGSVVSVGAVVTRSVPPNSIVAGSPARVVMRLNDHESKQAPDNPPPLGSTA